MKRYWDSCAFLGFLAGEADKLPECQPVIAQAQAGGVVIVTSALTLAEVLWLRSKPPIPVGDAQKVQRFFQHKWIYVYDVDRTLTERARDVVWNHGIHPKDALHVATALDAEVDQLDTFDADLIKKSNVIGNPPLAIGRPSAYPPGTLLSQ